MYFIIFIVLAKLVYCIVLLVMIIQHVLNVNQLILGYQHNHNVLVLIVLVASILIKHKRSFIFKKNYI